MSGSLPVHATKHLDVWKNIEASFGLDASGNPAARPKKQSWLAQFRRCLPKPEAIALTQAWTLRLFWLRRIEIWLTDVHKDSSYAFLDHNHLKSLGEAKALIDSLALSKTKRAPELRSGFPLLPEIPIPVWFSEISAIDIDIEKGLEAVRELGIEELELFGRQAESPSLKAVAASSLLMHDPFSLLNPCAMDGSLEAGQIVSLLSRLLPEKPYRVIAGPGGYKRVLPDTQNQWEAAMQACHERVSGMFILAPEAFSADRWQYHMALACIQAMHLDRGEEAALSPLPAFHLQVRIGDGLRPSLDTRLPMASLLPDQPVKLGLWRTALRRFHRASSVSEREEARHLLADLPRHFRAPLRPEGAAWRHLQRLLKLEQESQTLFSTGAIPEKLGEHIEQARVAFRKSNLKAFEWRYAFPEVLEAKTADFTGFNNMQLLLPESLLENQEQLLLAWVQMAWKLLKPGGGLLLWLPDNIGRWRKARPAFQWLETTGKITERRFCSGESFAAEVTGKEIVLWRKNE